MTDFGRDLYAAFGRMGVARDATLAPLTTFKVGGPADWLVEPRSSAEILTALSLARQAGIAVTLLGGGSNVLISDAGIRGLVVRPRGGEIRRGDDGHVTADAAVTVNGLVRWSIVHSARGLEAWAGTPGTVGGAIHGNAHFAGRLIGELVEMVRVVGRDGTVADVPAAALEFGYDRSRLQRTGEILLTATFRVSAGDPAALRRTARSSLAHRKRTQPLEVPSAGCIFRNPQADRDHVPEGLPSSAGALVDRAGLKGARIGGASVSHTHGNFIVNDGTATAADIHRLIRRCRDEVRRQFGVDLKEEIVCLGEFDVDAAD